MRSASIQTLASAAMIAGLLLWSVSAQAQGHGHGANPHAAPGADTSAVPAEAHHAPTGAPPVNWADFGYGSKNTEGGDMQKGDEPMAPPLLLAILNFAIFAGILYWKAGPALTKYLANRHESIKSALEEAAKLQEQAKAKLQEYSERIADADAEVNTLIAQIRKDAEAERERIVADAERQAAQMRVDAEAKIESEFLAARRQLEREIVSKATEAAEVALKSKTSSADHDNLFSNFISGLESPDGTSSTNADEGWS